MKRSFVVLAALLTVAIGLRAQPRKNVLFVFGGLNHHLAYGSENDYEIGTNDFPVTPAHTPVVFGASYIRRGAVLGFELEGRTSLASTVLLRDPSDGDTVEVRTSPHVSVLLSLVFAPLKGAVQPYLQAGGGVDLVLAKDADYLSAYGYPISVPAPDFKDRLDPEVHVGAGLGIGFGRGWGIRLDGRYSWILDKPDAVRGLQGTAGAFLAF